VGIMTAIVTANPTNERRIDMDWVRIIAFALLILYHTVCFYAAVTPHNQALSPRTYEWVLVPMLALNPWRLLILFTVSGAATRFMADKMRPKTLYRTRSARLIPPLIFVTVALTPLMCFFAVAQWNGFHGSFIAYLSYYFRGDRSFCHPATCLITPNYYHLWFVAYLWVYTVILVGLLAWAPGVLRAMQSRLERALQGWGLILWPAAYLSLARILLESRFPSTLDLIHDWYNHAIYLGGFLFGFSLARSDAVWAALERIRLRTLIGALVCYAGIIAGLFMLLGADSNWSSTLASGVQVPHKVVIGPLIGMTFGFDQWLCIAAVFGFARHYLSERDGPVRRYLTDAIFPFYIIHQATILVGGYYLVRLRWDVRLEFALLVMATALSCFLTYEIVRRAAWLRPWFGLKTVQAPRQPQAYAWPARVAQPPGP
jgi:glucan biosynthesis protein C